MRASMLLLLIHETDISLIFIITLNVIFSGIAASTIQAALSHAMSVRNGFATAEGIPLAGNKPIMNTI